MTTSKERIESLKKDLRSETLSPEQLFQKHIVESINLFF